MPQHLADEESDVVQSLTEEKIKVVSLSVSDEDTEEVLHSLVVERMNLFVSLCFVHNDIEEGHERTNNNKTHDHIV